MSKEKKVAQQWWFWTIITIVLVASICAVIASLPKEPTKNYVDPEDFSESIQSNKEKAIADQVESYAKIYMSKHADKCPNSINDFLNKTDVLQDLKYNRDGDKCNVTYIDHKGNKQTIILK